MSKAMSWIYFDASALVKRYSREIGTPLVNELFRLHPTDKMICSNLGILEIVSVLVRKRNDGRLDQALFEQALIELKAEVIDHERFLIAPVDDDLLLSSLELIAKHNLNATDAVILRSLLNLRQNMEIIGGGLVLWTSDKRLARAAQAEGVTVFDPEIDTMERLHGLLGYI